MLSLFTPTHNPRYLARLEASLAAQTCCDFEWLILPNGAAGDIRPTLPQARILPHAGENKSIGALKWLACNQARGDVLVEVDHDDELTPTCLQDIVAAFADPSVDFVYSNCAGVNANGQPRMYSTDFGWKYRKFIWRDQSQMEAVAFGPGPASFSRIWFAPNHVRAWRRSFYDRLGGHNPALPVLDDQDLLCRTYLAGNARHIDRCLYVQHYHAGQSYIAGDTNATIQRQTLEMHDQYIERLALRWCSLTGLQAVDLCCGRQCPAGYIGVDLVHGPIRADLNGDWPFPDNSVGVFRAHDALEHMRDPIHTMREIERCLAPGGWLLSSTPSTDGRGAWQDPTHVSFWNENSFWYYTRREQAAFIGSPVRFQAVRLLTHFPSDWHRQHQIPYVQAHLMKPLPHTPGLMEI